MKKYPFAVCGLAEVPEFAARLIPSRMVSLLDPDTPVTKPVSVSHHLHLKMRDIRDPKDPSAPNPRMIEKLLDFDRQAGVDDFTLVHCFAGISRSTAAALVLVCLRYGTRELPNAVDWLWKTRPEVCPNMLLLSVGDLVLGTGQSLQRAGKVLRQRQDDLMSPFSMSM